MQNINLDILAKEILKSSKDADLFDESELKQSLLDSKIDLSKEYEKPISLIQMVEAYGYKKDVLTTSNISTTIGGAKSKKTFFATMLLSALLGYKDFAISGDLLGLNVILFDTEQAQYHVKKIGTRLIKLGAKINNIEIYSLRPYMPEKRKAIIEYYLKLNNGKYSFVIIDGIVDLLYDFNDLHESKYLSTKLMEWSANYNCHINVILHTNKDFGNARGHLGAELMNKSETVFRVTKEDAFTSKLSNEMSRNEGFKEFNFKINDEGLPERIDFPDGFYNNNPGKYIPQDQLIKHDEGLSENDAPF